MIDIYTRQLMYREERQKYDNLIWKDDVDLIREFKDIKSKLDNNPTWSASVSAMMEWKYALETELRKRALTVPD